MKKRIEKKREKEKRVVTLMIRLYCKKSHALKPVSARSARLWLNMPVIVATSAHLWIIRLSVPTAKFTATNRRCGTEYGRLCVFLGPG